MPRAFCLIVFVLFLCISTGAQEVSVSKESPPIGPPSAERFAARIEPDLKGRPERLQQYVDFFRREAVSDSRLFAFDVVPESTGDGKVTLKGYIEFPETRKSLVALLTTLGFKVDDQTESLPSEKLGEMLFGLVKSPHGHSYDRPQGRRTVVTDCLIGEPLFLLREDAGHFLVHSGDGYLGYVDADDIERVDESQFAEYMEGSRVRLTSNFEIDKDRVLPAGARLKLVAAKQSSATVELPTGEKIDVPGDLCEVGHVPTEKLDAIANNAKQLVGTRYFWGGKTSDGVDCSGLVQIGFSTVGINLPRDSYQQFYVGRLAATRWHRSDMRRGDTLYFLGSDGKIRHTGLYLGDDLFVQAVLPRVKVSSFNPDDENYDEAHDKSFAFAKRLVE